MSAIMLRILHQKALILTINYSKRFVIHILHKTTTNSCLPAATKLQISTSFNWALGQQNSRVKLIKRSESAAIFVCCV